MTRVEWLTVGGDPAAWERLGFMVAAEGVVPFMFTSLRIVPADRPGLLGWALSGIDRSIASIDGLPTEVTDHRAPSLAEHPNGAFELDHVVVLTSSLERTCDAIAGATGAPLKRVREVGSMRQGFHRVGSGGLIVEVVERAEVENTEGGDQATFWGVVVNVADLDAAVHLIGDQLIGEVQDAVQPGRRIATVRRDAGLGLPLALMSTG